MPFMPISAPCTRATIYASEHFLFAYIIFLLYLCSVFEINEKFTTHIIGIDDLCRSYCG